MDELPETTGSKSDEYIAEVLARRQGNSAAKIAAHLGMTRKEVYARMVALGYRKVEAWADWETEIVKTCWGKPNESAGTIAKKLDGKSRNAVIGKAHRLRLVTTRKPSSHQGLVIPPRGKQEKKPKKPKWMTTPPTFLPPDRPIADIDPISIMKLTSITCKAVVGSGCDGLAVYCGDEVFPGQSWCPAHCAIYFTTRKRA